MRRGYIRILSLTGCVSLALGQSDPGLSGPPIELVHIYNDESPNGMSPICVGVRPVLLE